MKKFSDEKKCVICFALVILMGLLLFYTYAGDSSGNNHAGIIRLHIIANSNSIGDQALKLKVRDAVIDHMQNQNDISISTDLKPLPTESSHRKDMITLPMQIWAYDIYLKKPTEI